MAVVVPGRQLDAAVLDAAADLVMHRHALQFTAEQLAGLGRRCAGRRGVRLGAHAEHFAVVAVRQVAVRETRAGEDILHELFIVRLARTDRTAGRDDRRRILRRAQAALNFHTGDTRVHQLPQVRDVVHIFQAQMAGLAGLAGFQACAGVKGQAAGPGAGAPVAAAAAQKGAHHALAGHTHAECAVDEHLHLNGAGLADGADFIEGQLTRENDAVIPQGGQFFGPFRRVDAHLGRAVQVQRRCNALDQLRRGKIVGNYGIRARFGHSPHRVGQARQFAVIDQRVQRDMDLDAARMAEGHSLPQFIGGKVARRAACIKARQPQINSISAAENSGAKHLTVARRG